MAKPTPLQVRNIVIAVLAVAIGIFNIVRGGPVWATVLFGLGCVLAVGSAVLNNGGARR